MQRINSVDSTRFWGTVISEHETTEPPTGLRQRDREKKHKTRTARETNAVLGHIYKITVTTNPVVRGETNGRSISGRSITVKYMLS
jgi:hypothetical protein